MIIHTRDDLKAENDIPKDLSPQGYSAYIGGTVLHMPAGPTTLTVAFNAPATGQSPGNGLAESGIVS